MRARLCFLVLSGVWLFLVPPVLAAIQAAGADIVTVIDQSGSMSGKGAATVANDRHGKRISFFKSFTPKLIDSARRGMTNRLSVIEFGGRNARDPHDRPQITLSGLLILPFGPNVPNRSEDDVRRDIEVGLMKVQPQNRGDTDHAEALRLTAQEMARLSANPPQVPVGGERGDRKRIVLLITDGKSYAAGVSASKMLQETEQHVKSFPTGTVFMVLGLNDASEHYWNEDSPRWRRLASKDSTGDGLAFLARREEDVIPNLLELLSTVVLPSPLITEDDFHTVPPYLRAMHLVVDFDQPGLPITEVNILDPQGQRALPATGVYQWSNGLEFRIAHPQPGRWQLRTSNARYRVSIDYELEQAKLIAPQSPVSQQASSLIRYQLSGRGPGGLFQEEPDFPPLQFTVTVASPSGKKDTLSMKPDRDNPGQVISDTPFQATETGEYRLRFRGEIQVAGSQSSYTMLYSSEDAQGDSLLVNQSTPLRLRIDTPAPGQRVELLGGQATLRFRAQFIDSRDGRPLSLDQVLTTEDNWSVSYLIPGLPEGKGVTLKQKEQALEAELPLDLSLRLWRYLLNEGELWFRFHAPLDPFPNTLYYQGVEGGTEWESVPYRFKESPLTLIFLAAGLAAVPVLLFLLWWFFGRRWLIARQDRLDKRRPRLLYKVPDEPDFNKEWELTGQRVIRPTPRRVEIGGGETWEIKDFVVHRLSSPGGRVGVKLTYRPRPEKTPKETVNLRASDDDGRGYASGRINGLDTEAYFVLLRGKQG